MGFIDYFILIDFGIVLKEVLLTPGLGSGVHCRPRVRVNRRSNAIPVHPITTGSAKLPDCLPMMARKQSRGRGGGGGGGKAK